MRIILIFILLAVCTHGYTDSSNWTAAIQKKQSDELTTTPILFQKGERKQIYTPKSKSLWALEIFESKAGNKTYFITFWSLGGRNLLLRVFDPEISNTPLCEAISFGETSELRIHNGYLQLYVVPDSNPGMYPEPQAPYWQNCRQLNNNLSI